MVRPDLAKEQEFLMKNIEESEYMSEFEGMEDAELMALESELMAKYGMKLYKRRLDEMRHGQGTMEADLDSMKAGCESLEHANPKLNIGNSNVNRIRSSNSNYMLIQPGSKGNSPNGNGNGQPGIATSPNVNNGSNIMTAEVESSEARQHFKVGSWARESEEGAHMQSKQDQYTINSEMGQYGLHSPKKTMDRNDSLMAIMATTKKEGAAVWLQRMEDKVTTNISNEIRQEAIDSIGDSQGQNEMNNKGKNPISSMETQANTATNHEEKDEGWEVPKRKHTFRARGGSMGSPQGLEIGNSSKGEGNNMNSMDNLDSIEKRAVDSKHDPDGRERQGSNKESPSVVEMGQGSGPSG
ncbi:hypothetical protein FRX31_033556 [Thalictrum thalictroides]|uniref:Uncharacterized protein n=1 Tax=Thalictrum thalictroides TaxID=46969 RepID=A0A7J6UX99_THATH|nr:hypothetical protein FRX31_033556 [Thalictrum thalictroides]